MCSQAWFVDKCVLVSSVNPHVMRDMLRRRRPAFQILWHKPFPNAPQLFDVCATERLFVSQHADFQVSSCVAAAVCPPFSSCLMVGLRLKRQSSLLSRRSSDLDQLRRGQAACRARCQLPCIMMRQVQCTSSRASQSKLTSARRAAAGAQQRDLHRQRHDLAGGPVCSVEPVLGDAVRGDHRHRCREHRSRWGFACRYVLVPHVCSCRLLRSQR